MPRQPPPKMHVQLDVSHVRSQRKTCSASAGPGNSTHARGKSRSTSGTGTGYGPRPRSQAPSTVDLMRLGVLDVGSNTVHLLVVDAHAGAPPVPAFSDKGELRLAELIDDKGCITPDGADRLVDFVTRTLQQAEDKG